VLSTVAALIGAWLCGRAVANRRQVRMGRELAERFGLEMIEEGPLFGPSVAGSTRGFWVELSLRGDRLEVGVDCAGLVPRALGLWDPVSNPIAEEQRRATGDARFDGPRSSAARSSRSWRG
jgi:hypothetical protein